MRKYVTYTIHLWHINCVFFWNSFLEESWKYEYKFTYRYVLTYVKILLGLTLWQNKLRSWLQSQLLHFSSCSLLNQLEAQLVAPQSLGTFTHSRHLEGAPYPGFQLAQPGPAQPGLVVFCGGNRQMEDHSLSLPLSL